MGDSVTVSMLAEMIGIARPMRRLKQVCVLTARRERTDERRGTKSTSSNVSAVSGRSFIGMSLQMSFVWYVSGTVLCHRVARSPHVMLQWFGRGLLPPHLPPTTFSVVDHLRGKQ